VCQECLSVEAIHYMTRDKHLGPILTASSTLSCVSFWRKSRMQPNPWESENFTSNPTLPNAIKPSSCPSVGGVLRLVRWGADVGQLYAIKSQL